VRAAGLEGLERRMFSALSGGQKQRVLFALAICGRPDLLLLDEPTAGLDVESRHGLWRHIRAFLAGGGSVLLTTHYLEEADALASRVVVIDRGKRVAAGTPKTIKDTICSKQITCVTALADEALLALNGVQGVRREGPRAVLTVSDSDAVLPRLFVLDPRVSEVEVKGAALEDAFLKLTEVA
jgi:ABC-2 type transport system ATP-binding protein